MKKLFFALLIVAMVASVCYAELPADPNRRIKAVNVSLPGGLVSSTIGTGDLIVGISVCGTAACGAALYNAATAAACTNALVLAEVGSTTGSTGTVWFPYAVEPTSTMYVVVAGATTATVATIYYEDR